MNDVVSWVAECLAALLFVAVVVAWWEHLGSLERRRGADLDGDPESQGASGPRVTSVDVDLDATPAPIVLEGDAAARREVLDGAITRMSRDGSTAATRSAWIDTAPMIGQGMGAATSADAELQPERAP
jgi:hypothetical protein